MRLIFAILLAGGLSAQGLITTVAGNGAAGFSGDGGPAVSAVLNRPVYVLTLDGNLYIADESNQRIRRVDSAGVITTFAGNGTAGFSGDGGPATAASLRGPAGLCADPAGNIYINDVLNHRVRQVDRQGIITTYAGDGNTATMNLPIRCAVDANGVMYIAEQGGHRVRRVGAGGGSISTVAGNGNRGFSGDGGPAANATLDNPTAVAVDFAGNVFVTDQFNQRIRRIAPDGVITTIAGTGVAGFSGDNGPATSAQLNFPGALVLDPSGRIYFSDGPNHRVRRIEPNGVIRTVVGNGSGVFGGDGGPALAGSLNGAFGLALDAGGNLFIADTLNQRVRRVSPLAPLTPPSFTSTSVVNAASFASGITPGGLATIFGKDLSPANGVLVTGSVPWPERLAGVAVRVDGVNARIYSLVNIAGQEQISFQVPFSAGGSPTAEVVVDHNSTLSGAVNVPVRPALPGIFVIDAARNGAFLHADFGLVTAGRPATRGEVLLMYLTGLGAVTPQVANGEPAPSREPFARTAETPTVTVGGVTAQVFYSGLAPGFVGLYQINFQVPATAPVGAVDVVVMASGSPSNAARLEVR